MRPAVFRGIGAARATARVASLVSIYAGGFGVLWGLGLVVRGWQGWALLATPLAAMIALRLWAWSRVSVEVTADRLRYEDAVPARDFEVPLEQIEAVYFDRHLPGEPLVIATGDDEHVCGELSARAARELYEHLRARGVPAPHAAAA
ncbi:MAG TPA: hypothetical protein VIL20_02910 [Sandaracinaceae bacterium]